MRGLLRGVLFAVLCAELTAPPTRLFPQSEAAANVVGIVLGRARQRQVCQPAPIPAFRSPPPRAIGKKTIES
jgi:hypothetical protein